MEKPYAETVGASRADIVVEPADAVAGMRKWERLDTRQSPAHLGILAVHEAFPAPHDVFNQQFERKLYGAFALTN